MKSLSIDLPDNLATAVESYVKAGFSGQNWMFCWLQFLNLSGVTGLT